MRENSTTTNELAYYSYDPLSRRVFQCLGAGTGTGCPAGTWTNKAAYAYEPNSNLASLTQTLNAASVVLSYGHNGSGQILSVGATDSFYLSSAPASPASTAYVPDKLNRYGSVAGLASTYDKNGNMQVWYPLNTAASKQTLTYDSENRLVTAAVNGATTASISYDYDGLGRREKKTVGIAVNEYLLDGDEEIAEYSGTTLLRRYITGPGVDDRIAHVEYVSGLPYKTFYHTNHQGSVLAMTDSAGNSTGCAATVNCQVLAYDEYGNLTSTPPAVGNGEMFRFTGRRYDKETGLYYYRARYYAPQMGRFLQTDPVGYKGDVNLYAYVGNDPLDKTDPTGKWCIFGVIGTTCTPDTPPSPPSPQTQPAPTNQPSIWRKLIDKAENFFKPAELQKEDKPAEPPGNAREAELKKLKDLAKDKAKDLLKDAAKEAARKAGATDAQICEAEHCAAAGARMSVCLMTYCGEELGLGGNDAVDNKRQP